MEITETIKFKGKKFPIVYVTTPWGERRVSSTILNETLMNSNGSYVSVEATQIHESIFYFVEDEVLKLNEDEIVNKIFFEL